MIVFLTAQAATLVVDADGSADHTSIQAAIDAAADGDVIEVRNGTYTEGSISTDEFADVGGMLVFGKSVTVVGESVDGVVVQSGLASSLPRTAAIQFAPGTYDVSVSKMTFDHSVAGTATSYTGTYAYTAFGQNGPYNSITGSADLSQLIVVMHADRAKSMSYQNSQDFESRMENLTIDFGSGTPGIVSYNNHENTSSYLRDSILVNTDCRWVDFGNFSSETFFAMDYTTFFGCGEAPAGDGNLITDPMFNGAGDYGLASGSPAEDGGDPSAANNDDDGSPGQQGAYGNLAGGSPATQAPPTPTEGDEDLEDRGCSTVSIPSTSIGSWLRRR